MVKFIPIRYSNKNYPSDIEPKIQEITTNFCRKNLQRTALPYLSLHTDPGRRWEKDKILSSELLNDFPAIINNMFDLGRYCVSKLWFNKAWGKEFSGFLVRLTEGTDRQRIKVIEIHPPFDTYCDSLETFLEIYATFEEEVLKEFPSATINIENRCNTAPKRKGGKFILSRNDNIVKLSNLISKSNLKLKLVVDVPQLFSEHYERKLLSEEMIKEVLAPMWGVRDFISGTHIWGYNITKEKKDVHSADLNTYLNNDQKVKDCFLQEICKLFNDGKARYFLPEVGSSNAVKSIESIVNDLRNAGVDFVEPE